MLLDIKNINKSFDDVNVLNNIDLNINKSDVITIFGHSGVGKSTLLSISSGMVMADSGQIRVDSILMNASNSAKIRKKYIGILFQKNNLLPEFTVTDNLLLPLIINNYKYNNEIERVDYLLELLELSNLKHRFPNTLSRGENQRISLLR